MTAESHQKVQHWMITNTIRVGCHVKLYLQQLLCSIKSCWSTSNNTEMRVYCCSASPSYQILNYTPSAWVKWPSAQHVEAYKIILPKVICVLVYVLKQTLNRACIWNTLMLESFCLNVTGNPPLAYMCIKNIYIHENTMQTKLG